MSTVRKTVGVILYALVAGFAAATTIILGSILLALFFGWLFDSLGWLHARDAAASFISYYIYIIGLGLAVGLLVCFTVCIRRLRSLDF